jgi:hypothetical protein
MDGAAIAAALRAPHEVAGQTLLAVAAAPIVVDRHPVAYRYMGDARAKRVDDAAGFVARDCAVARTRLRRLPVEMQVTSAQAAGHQLDDHFPRPWLWIRIVSHLGLPAA